MISTEEANNKRIRINEASMICDKNKYFNFKSFSEERIKSCYSEDRHPIVKGGLK